MYKEFLIYIIIICLLIYIIPHIIFKNRKNIDPNKAEIIAVINAFIPQYNIYLSEADAISQKLYHELSMMYPTNHLINKKIEKCQDTFCSTVEDFNKRLTFVEENMAKIEYDELYDIKYLLQNDIYSMDDEIEAMKMILQDILSINTIEKNSKKEKMEEKQKGNRLQYMYFKGCDNIDLLEKRFKMLAKIYHPDNQFGNNDIFLSMQNEYLQIKKKMEEQSYEENSI